MLFQNCLYLIHINDTTGHILQLTGGIPIFQLIISPKYNMLLRFPWSSIYFFLFVFMCRSMTLLIGVIQNVNITSVQNIHCWDGKGSMKNIFDFHKLNILIDFFY